MSVTRLINAVLAALVIALLASAFMEDPTWEKGGGWRVEMRVNGGVGDSERVAEHLRFTNVYYGMYGGHLADVDRPRHPGFSVLSYSLTFSSGLPNTAGCWFGDSIQMPPGPTPLFPTGKDPRGPVDLDVVDMLLTRIGKLELPPEVGWHHAEQGWGIPYPSPSYSVEIKVYSVPDEFADLEEWGAALAQGPLLKWHLVEGGALLDRDASLERQGEELRDYLASELDWLAKLAVALPAAPSPGDLMAQISDDLENRCASMLSGVLDSRTVLWPFLRGDYLPEPDGVEVVASTEPSAAD